MKLWTRFKTWAQWKITGKRWTVGYDFESTGIDFGESKTIVTVGYYDRKNVLHITEVREWNTGAIVKAMQQMGTAAGDAAKAFAEMSKALPYKEFEKAHRAEYKPRHEPFDRSAVRNQTVKTKMRNR